MIVKADVVHDIQLNYDVSTNYGYPLISIIYKVMVSVLVVVM
jgi:hypothetical protein